MSRTTPDRFDVLVVGGGPAGIAAAVRAAECGASVGLADDNAAVGGQIWRGSEDSQPKEALTWRARLQRSGAVQLCGTRVFDRPRPGLLLAEGSDDLFELRYKTLVLATGARELFLPFPGWTIPNVIGAGGLQAMVKSGLPIRGTRVVVAGSGPLLLAVAGYLKKHGAEIPLICEQAPWSNLARLAASLITQPATIGQAVALKKNLVGVPFATSSWPVAAHGQKALESVTVSRAGTPETIPCDFLACGFHLVPNIELPLLIGCQIRCGFVRTDEFQQTTVPAVFCAGEPTGIGGVELSLLEGQIAGLAAAGHMENARPLFAPRANAFRFARNLQSAFSLRPELRSLPSADTLVCRCEDVSLSRLQKHTSWHSAKLHTRCGMGPCQGRVCGPATRFLFKWNPDSVRPPVFPARVENLAVAAPAEPEHTALTGGSR